MIKMDFYASALELLNERYRADIKSAAADAEEIRLRAGQYPAVLCTGRETVFSDLRCTPRELERVVEKATSASMHTALASLEGGYLNYMGVRIGICGEANMRGTSFTGFRAYSSVCIRIPRELRGISAPFAEFFSDSTLILSPPGGGKTTFLRDAVRTVSGRRNRVALIDERGELAASSDGVPQYEIGPCTDVITGCEKNIAAIMVLRSMSPQYIAVDEITKPGDVQLIREIVGCGVRVLATAHADGAEDLKKRPVYREILSAGLFQNAIEIRCSGGRREYKAVRLDI